MSKMKLKKPTCPLCPKCKSANTELAVGIMGEEHPGYKCNDCGALWGVQP